MNQVESAVSSVVPRRRRAVPAGVTTTQPDSPEPAKRTRGRQAIVLKGGKPYKEALEEAKAKVKDARAVLVTAKATLREYAATLRLTGKAQRAADKEAARVASKPLPDKLAQKAALAAAKERAKTAAAAVKTAAKAWDAQAKLIAKAEAALAKAEDGRLKVEQAKLAAKALTIN
jgi:hypothetical protein